MLRPYVDITYSCNSNDRKFNDLIAPVYNLVEEKQFSICLLVNEVFFRMALVCGRATALPCVWCF